MYKYIHLHKTSLIVISGESCEVVKVGVVKFTYFTDKRTEVWRVLPNLPLAGWNAE